MINTNSEIYCAALILLSWFISLSKVKKTSSSWVYIHVLVHPWRSCSFPLVLWSSWSSNCLQYIICFSLWSEKMHNIGPFFKLLIGDSSRKMGGRNIWVLTFHVLCQKKRKLRGKCRNKLGKKMYWSSIPPKNAVLSPALLNRKPSYLMQYLVSSDTNTEFVIFRNKIKCKKKPRKKNHVYIYLTNVKGFFLFMCASCESKILLFLIFGHLDPFL